MLHVVLMRLSIGEGLARKSFMELYYYFFSFMDFVKLYVASF